MTPMNLMNSTIGNVWNYITHPKGNTYQNIYPMKNITPHPFPFKLAGAAALGGAAMAGAYNLFADDSD